LCGFAILKLMVLISAINCWKVFISLNNLKLFRDNLYVYDDLGQSFLS
jgi:hypothetical protein